MRLPKKLIAVALLALAPAASAMFARHVIAGDPPRTISIYNIHTEETLSIVYKEDGKYVPEAMKQINWFMRDWRRNEVITIDPALIDILWEVHEELGSKEPIHLICGYRSRSTNEMLRKTVGGQASQSRHILGKAADVSFPDVPVKQLRYSALIRERGGVGYYPTSAIPFVHIDTDRVRHWPGIPRFELALLFPNGKSKHLDGRAVTAAEVKEAREQHKDVALDVANFFELRSRPKPPILVASAAGVPAPVPVPSRAKRPSRPTVMAAAMGPTLVSEPRLVERSSKLTPGPSAADRGHLDKLVTLAAFEPEGAPVSSGVATAREKFGPPVPPPGSFVAAPAYDEEHPEELSYRPFPIAPLLTATASPDDPALAHLAAPDLARAIDLIDDEGTVPPLQLRAGEQASELAWAQQFQGKTVSYDTLRDAEPPKPEPAGLAQRTVTTSLH